MKKSDRRLMLAMILCLGSGLLLLVFTLHAYFKHQLLNDKGLDWDKPLPVAVYQPLLEAARTATYEIYPVISIVLLFSAYTIWNYRHKRGVVKDHDKPDA